MFAVTQELLLMFPREKAGAHRLVCDLQSEIDLLFQSIRANQSTLEEAAKLRDLQLQHAAISGSLASCVAEKIAIEQLLHKEREEASAKHRIMLSQAEADIRQHAEAQRSAERTAAAQEKAQLAEQLSATEMSCISAREGCVLLERKLAVTQQEIHVIKEANEQMKRAHETECENLREQIRSQNVLLESAEHIDGRKASFEVRHHEEMASIMMARAEHVCRSSRKFMLIRRAFKMFHTAFGRWKSAVRQAKSLKKFNASRMRRDELGALHSSFFIWRIRSKISSRAAVSPSSAALSRSHLSQICGICNSATAHLLRSEIVASHPGLQALSASVSQVHSLAKLAQQALVLETKHQALLPDISVDGDSSDDEGTQTLNRLTALLNEVSAKLVHSQSECEMLRSECLESRALNELMLSQQAVLQAQMESSIQSIYNVTSAKMSELQQRMQAAIQGAKKCMALSATDCSLEDATVAAFAALNCFVFEFTDDSSQNDSSNNFQEAITRLKSSSQTAKDLRAAELARALEENTFITQRLQSLSRTLDDDYELVSRSMSTPNATQSVSLIERAIAALNHRHERALETSAATISEHQLLIKALTEKNEALEKKVSEVESFDSFTSSSITDKIQQVESIQADVVHSLQENSKKLHSEKLDLLAELKALRSENETLTLHAANHLAQIARLEKSMAASMETIELMQIEIENSKRETKFASAVQSELAAA